MSATVPRGGRRRAALLAAMLVAGCAPGENRTESTVAASPAARAVEDDTPAPEAVSRARAAADALGRELQGRLVAAIEAGGPLAAVAYCADSAQALTARHAREGTYVRRVSLRVRNPANRPDSAEAAWLHRLDSLHRAGALPAEVVRAARGRDGVRTVEYLRPIVVQPRCLTCHGDAATMPPAVRALVASRYPSDSATGYRDGDLRGMISVRLRE